MRSSNSTNPRAPHLNVVSMFAMCDAGFWSFNFFLFQAFSQLNVKEGARGYTWVCSSSGAGFCPSTVAMVLVMAIHPWPVAMLCGTLMPFTIFPVTCEWLKKWFNSFTGSSVGSFKQWKCSLKDWIFAMPASIACGNGAVFSQSIESVRAPYRQAPMTS